MRLDAAPSQAPRGLGAAMSLRSSPAPEAQIGDSKPQRRKSPFGKERSICLPWSSNAPELCVQQPSERRFDLAVTIPRATYSGALEAVVLFFSELNPGTNAGNVPGPPRSRNDGQKISNGG